MEEKSQHSTTCLWLEPAARCGSVFCGCVSDSQTVTVSAQWWRIPGSITHKRNIVKPQTRFCPSVVRQTTSYSRVLITTSSWLDVSISLWSAGTVHKGQNIFNNFIINQCSVIKIPPHIRELLLVVLHLLVWGRKNVLCHNSGNNIRKLHWYITESVAGGTESFTWWYCPVWEQCSLHLIGSKAAVTSYRCSITSRRPLMCAVILMTLQWIIMKLLNFFCCICFRCCTLWTVPADHRG